MLRSPNQDTSSISRKDRLRAAATSQIIDGIREARITQGGWKATPEDMQLPHSTLEYEAEVVELFPDVPDEIA